MQYTDFIFNGKRFRYLKDFEREFKPTKWSIRKYLTFLKDLEPEVVNIFDVHTINMFGKFHITDKDTMNFIKQIIEKRNKSFKELNDYMFWSTGHTPIDFINGIDMGASISVPKEKYNKLIKVMVMLQKEGIIQGSLKDIAEILINYFGVKYSESTILAKMYGFSGELQEENMDNETFKKFRLVVESI